jgi:tetratricopeptide (TPR) repeat protein
MPHFPGESLAEYYGASSWDDKQKKLTVGLIQEGRLAEVESDIAGGDMMSLEKLITTDGMYEHYTWGWSLVHFLMNSEKYGKKFQRFVTTLALGKDVKREVTNFGGERLSAVDGPEILRVFMKSLDLRDKPALAALEADWHKYVRSELQFVTPHGMETAGFKAISTYPARPIRAKKLLQQAIDAGSKNALAYNKLAEIIVQDGEIDRAIELWRKSIELDPLTAHFYSNLGHALIKKGKQDEGKRMVALAKELDPDDPYLDLDLRVK